MASKKTRRTRSPHPGIKIKSRKLPSGATRWIARFRDPDTNREVDVTLDALALTTADARRLWAIRKAKDIAKRAMELEAGAPRIARVTVVEAIRSFDDNATGRLRDRTREIYGKAAAKLAAWCKRNGVEHTAELTAPRVAAFRNSLIAAKRVNVKRGGKRGEREATEERKRSPWTANIEIRSARTVLNEWRVSGLVPLTKDQIADTMKTVPVPREQPEFLPPSDLQRLLQAALRHDAECFAETRAEHVSREAIGTTARYEPIAPFVAFLVLTGCRRGEALRLRWERVDLDALDHSGKKAGEIRLTAAETKTKISRTIGLELSPALHVMLAALKLRGGRTAVHVFGGEHHYTDDLIEAARKRLLSEYGAPPFDWQVLRSTCATFLTNSNIFDGSTVWRSAKQLGHSPAVAEKHYLGVLRGIPRDARTLEAAMRIEDEMRQVILRIASTQTIRHETGPSASLRLGHAPA